MKKLLIPIDFSENADHAIGAALLIAHQEQTHLLILHAYQPYIADVAIMPGMGAPDFMTLTTDLENQYHEKLDRYVAELRAQGFSAESLWVLGGVSSSISEAIASHRPDMVILGRTGTGGFIDKLIGSTATDIALHSEVPVLVIPPQAAPRKFANVVYATQLEYSELDILKEVFLLMNTLGSKLTLLKVKADTQPDIQPDQQYLQEIKGAFNLSHQDIVIRKAKHVVDGIEDYCDEVQADLLVVSSRERSFLEEFIINPSITKKLIVDTHIPLLVFHLNA